MEKTFDEIKAILKNTKKAERKIRGQKSVYSVLIREERLVEEAISIY